MSIDGLHRLYANIGKIITSELTYQGVVEGIMLEVQHFFAPEHWSLMRLDSVSDELFFVAIRGMELDRVKDIRLKLGEGVAGKVAQSGVSRFVPDTTAEPEFSRKVDEATGFKTKSIIAVPMIFRDKTYGVIEVVNKVDGSIFNATDHLTLRTIADFAAIAFSNLQMFERVKTMAYTDPLTGAYNRAKLNKTVEKRISMNSHEQRKHTFQFSVVFFIDIDFFKKINDTHGHRYGDEILMDFVEKTHELTREEDDLYRIGGDEFILVTDAEDMNTANQIHDGLAKRFDELNTCCNKDGVSYTFSFGSSIGSFFELEKVIQKADVNMYGKRQKDREIPRQ